jgi:hypothetical protein
MNAHSLTKKFIEFRQKPIRNNGEFFSIKYQFELLVTEYGEEFTEYLLKDTIAWAEEGHGTFFSPKFLWYRIKDVKPKYDADKKALEEKLEAERKLTQSTFKMQDKKAMLKSDMSIFE